jgi:hypothetical protein
MVVKPCRSSTASASEPRLISEIRRGYRPTLGPQSDLVGIDALALEGAQEGRQVAGGQGAMALPSLARRRRLGFGAAEKAAQLT